MTNEQLSKKLEKEITTFVAERDWEQFHSPKNLAMALTVETAEILEIFQWLSEKQSSSESHVDKKHLEEEIGDVMIYLTTLAKAFNIDLHEAALNKMKINRRKYPVEKAKEKANKYSNFRD